MRWAGGNKMKKTFLKYDKATLTVMVQADNPDRIKELIDKSLPCGAEAFGMQFEKLEPEYRKKEVYKELFSYSDKPVYVTNYRKGKNEGKTDDVLADELLELSDCGATLCDVIGDLFDRQPDEVAVDEKAIEKQIKLIDALHKKGAEVLISSHILKYTPAERVLEVAKEHHVPIVENKALARMLYYNVELDTEIPEELYQMTAEVLAYVYQLKNK